MAENPKRDDELIELTAKRLKWRKAVLQGYALVIFAIATMAGMFFQTGVLSPDVIVSGLVKFLPLVLLIFGIIPLAIWKMRPPKEYYSERIALKQADKLQYGRRRFLFLLPLIVALMTPAVVDHTLKIADGEGHLPDYLIRVETHKIHQTIAATRQMDARKFLASLS